MSIRLAKAQDALEIKVGDYGWYLELDLVDKAINVDNATGLAVLYTKPDGVTSGSWPAGPHSQEKTVLRRKVEDGDFDVAGNWVLRAEYVDSANGVRLTGDPARVRVID